MAQADALERQMLQLINAERTSRGLNPVQLELRLNDAAEDHSEWMLQADVFSHTGAGGSSAGQRMEAAGFVFSGSWRWAENIAWQSERGAPGLKDDVIDLHNGLMNSPGHRANILNPDVTVIGIGIEYGKFNGWDAVMVTQNFAKTSAPLQLESANNYPVVFGTATEGADNLSLLSPGLVNGLSGNDTLTGSSGHDQILGGAGQDYLLGLNGRDEMFGGSGNDTIIGGGGRDTVSGEGGNDKLLGKGGDDTLQGGSGNDRLTGGNGNDVLQGGNGFDTIWSGAGDDWLDGGEKNDKLVGGSGSDVFVFSPGADVVKDFDARDPREQIDLAAAAGISSYIDLRAQHISISATGLVIADEHGNTMLLENVSLADLDPSDFIF